jgi:phospholipase C
VLSPHVNENGVLAMALSGIDHVVVLMLENQSFDSLLGWLYDANDKPANNIPAAALGDEFRGLAGIDPGQFVNSGPYGLSVEPGRGAAGITVPTPDPGEEFEHVNIQFFGTATPPPGATPTMTGVLADYVEVMKSFGYAQADIVTRAPSIMGSFTPAQLPVLNQLAAHYAVCDGWFASVPSQTNPNRAFLLTGTSHGLVNNGELEDDPNARVIESVLHMSIGDDRFPEPTIFNALASLDKDWAVFWQTSYLPQKITTLMAAGAAFGAIPGVAALLAALLPSAGYLAGLTSGQLDSSFTHRLFPAIQSIPGADSHFASIDVFHQRARTGTLPAFSYIEPFWTISQKGTDESNPVKRAVTAMGNDYHPPSNKLVGEAFVASVYASLTANTDAWNRTLLLITFDEHVGSFDHVGPPCAVPPGEVAGLPPIQSTTKFGFDRYGARVPTILVSPLIEQGTVLRAGNDSAPFDHTSVISTVLTWAGASRAEVEAFGARTAAAPTFDGVVTLDTPRTDAAAMPFMNPGRANGDPLNFGDLFRLQHSSSATFVSSFSTESKKGTAHSGPAQLLVDFGLYARFPKMAAQPGVVLTFLSPVPTAGPAIDAGAPVWLASTEPGLGADSFLGDWDSGTWDRLCYWYDLYLDGEYAPLEQWTIEPASSSGPIAFGSKVSLRGGGSGKYLTRSGRKTGHAYVATDSPVDWWTVVPVTG